MILLALDLEGRITLMNRKGCDVLGWAEGELIGRDFIETCVPARIRDETRRKLSDVHAGDDSIVENAIVTSSGDERLIEWRTSFQRDDEGRIDHQTIRRVLTLLPKRPAQVVIVDPNQAGADIRGTLLRIEAFITKGGRVVYLTTHSEALQGALKGWSLHEYILASIIWHEMAHIDGADEIEAQRREEALWTRYVMDERVDPGAESPPAGSSRPHRRRSSCHGRLAGRTYLHGLVGFGVEGVP